MGFFSEMANNIKNNQSTKSAYQQNLSQPVQAKQQNWYAGSVPTTGEIYGRIQEIRKTDPERASTIAAGFAQAQMDRTSPWYDPYTQPTNQAVGNLKSFGIDPSSLTDEWFANNKGWQDHLRYSATTNSPLSPTKRASQDEIIAFNIYQYQKSEEQTKKAEREWEALQQELKYKASNPYRNDSDDEIMNSIDWSKYQTLASMKDSLNTPSPIELNRSVPFSEDAMRGVLWAARNNGGTGNTYSDIASAALKEGNGWKEDPVLRAKLDWNNRDTYSPYSAGMTLENDVGLYFGVYEFDADTLDQIRASIDPNDETSVKMYNKARSAFENTQKAEAELAALEKRIDIWTSGSMKKDKVLANVERYIDKNCPTLKAMDDSIQDGSKLVDTTKAINYKRQELLDDVGRFCDARIKNTGEQYVVEAGQDSIPVDAVSGAAASVNPVPAYSEQEQAVIAKKNETLADAADVVEEAGTPVEKTVAKQSWSAVFDNMKTALKGIRDSYSGAYSRLTQQSIRKSIGATAEATLSGAETIAAYDRNAERLTAVNGRMEEIEKSLGDLIYARKNVESYNKGTMDITVGGIPRTASIEYNDRTGQYELKSILRKDGKRIPMKDADQEAAMEEINRRMSGIADMRQKIASVSGAAMSDEELAMLDEYNKLSEERNTLSQYAKENEAAYNEAQQKTKDAEALRTATINMLTKAGVSVEELKVFEETGAVIDVLNGFTKYDPTQWEAYNAYDLYAREIAFSGAEGYDKILAAAKEGDDQNRQELETALWVLDYSERMGITLPDNVKNNLNRYIAKLERDHKDYEYFALLSEKNFKEEANRGRQEIADAEFDWTAWDGTLENQPGWNLLSDEQKDQLLGMMEQYDINDIATQFNGMVGQEVEDRMLGGFYAKNLMSDYELDTYYYLFATEGREAAEQYFDHLSDGSYGALTVRSKEVIQAGATELADQGFWGRRAADVMSMILSPAAALGSLAYDIEYGINKATGKDVEYNPNNYWLSFNQFRTAARSEIQAEINRTYGEDSALGKLFSSVQEIISNRGDSMMNMMAFGWLTSGMSAEAAQEFIGALPMAVGAAADTMAEAKERGASDTQAWILGSVALMFEAGTEAISIDNISKAFKMGGDIEAGTVKEFLKEWVTTSGWSEAFGETLTDAIEQYADEKVMGDLSEHARRVAELKEANPNLSDEDADAMARREEFAALMHTALVSFLSPGTDIVPLAAGRANYYRAQTRFARENGAKNINIFDVMKADKAIRERVDAGAEAMIEVPEAAAEEQTETTENAEPAEAAAPQEEAPEQGAGTAVSEEEQKQTEAQQIAADYMLLDKAQDGDTKSKTATIAAVLDIEGTDASSDTSKAVAAKLDDFLKDTFGGKAQEATEWLKGLLLGASEGDVNVSDLKQAITNMVLGGMDSAAYQELYNDKVGGLTEEFVTADLDHQAQRLAKTVAQDAANGALQTKIANSIYEARVADAEGKIIADGGTTAPGSNLIASKLVSVQRFQKAADAANRTLLRAGKDYLARQKTQQASAEAVQKATANLNNDPSEANKKILIDALAKHRSNVIVTTEYEQALQKAREKVQTTDADVMDAREDMLNTLRQQAEQMVAQEDQRRAGVAEEQRIAAEQAAVVQQQEQAMRESSENALDADIETMIEQEYPNATDEQKEHIREMAKQAYDTMQQEAAAEGAVTVDELLNRKKVLNRLGKRYGFNVDIRDTTEGGKTFFSEGYFDRDTNTLVLDRSTTLRQAMYKILGHELTHIAEQSQTYGELANALLRDAYGEGVTYNGILQQMESGDISSQLAQDILSKKATYDEVLGKEHSYKYMLEEVIADKMGDILNGDQELINRLAKEEPSVIRRIIDAIKNFINGNKNVKGEWQTESQRIVDMLETALSDAQKKNDGEGKRYRLFGTDPETGKQVYMSNFDPGTPAHDKGRHIYKLLSNIWSKKPITLMVTEKDGTQTEIQATFNPDIDQRQFDTSIPRKEIRMTDAGKIAFGNHQGSKKEQRVMLNLADDYYELLENARYDNERENDQQKHPEDVKRWLYFVNDIYYAEKGSDVADPYGIQIDIKEMDDGHFVYSYWAAEQEGQQKKLSLMGISPVNTGNADESATASDEMVARADSSVKPLATDDQGNALATELPGGTVSVDGPRFSLSSFNESEQQKVRKALINSGRFSESEVDKYLDDVLGIASIIAADPDRLDFKADSEKTMLKPNAEYVKTLDASTLCAKRLLYQGTFDAIQHQLPNTPLLPENLIDLANMMREMGYETPCGICYVESRRRQLGKFTEQWLADYNGEYKPTIDEVTTTDGLAKLQAAEEGTPQRKAYDDFVAAMNKKGTMNPKVVQLRTDYRGEIRDMTPGQIQKVKDIGGLRIQSFSDFETPHLLDMAQAVMDMAAKDLTAQAYTKVPNFPWAFGDTGIKINMSLIGKGTGLDENGNLVFDDVEGMPFDEAMRIRDRYSKNVGTILVGINDAHILAAMADDRIDFIIPFHKSGWSSEELNKMPVLNSYSDYTNSQNEKVIVGRDKNGNYKTESLEKTKRVNFQPVGENGYWDFNKTGKENAEEYLRMCAEDKRLPKFSQFLVDNGDGSFSLQPDGSTDGYWKTLIDFKMYDNDGNGSPQMSVTPNINMAQANRILNDYSLDRNGITRESNNSLPVAQPVVDRYVEEYKKNNPGRKYSLTQQQLTDFSDPVWFDKYLQTLSAEEMEDLAQEMFGISLSSEPKDEAISKQNVTAKEKELPVAQLRDLYKDAMENGDRSKARNLIDRIAKKAGYTIKGTHRTNAEFTVFDRSKQTGQHGKTLGDGFYVAAGEGTEYDTDYYGKNRMLVYIRPGKVFNIQDKGLTKKQAKEVYDKYFAPAHPTLSGYDNPYTSHVIGQLQKSSRVMDYIKEAAENGNVTTDVIFKELGYDSIKDGPQYVVFDPEQIKSADLTTYGDNGEQIEIGERFNRRNPDIRYELPSDKYLQQKIQRYLKSGGSISAPLEGQNPTMTTGQGPKERAFGSADGMLMRSDEAGRFAKAVTAAQNTYFPDTNDAQIKRAIKWIGSLKQTPNSDGYAEALQAVTADDFDYRSADGQARMVAVMAMANAKNDTLAQTALDDAFNRQGTDIGRMMQARKLFLMMTPEGRQQAFRNMLRRQRMELGRRGKNIDLKFSNWIYQMAAAAQNENDLEKVREAAYNELADQIPANWRDRIRSLRMLSMLANPRTHIRNVIGNMLFIPAVSIKNKLGAAVEITTRQKERTKTLSLATSKENRDFARQDAKNIRGLLTGEAKYNEATRIRKAQSKLGKVFDWLSEKNSNALEKEDWFFLKGHYRRALGGWMQANGYTPAQLRSDSALLEKGRQYAISEAQKATYRDFNKTAAWLNQASRSGGVKGFVVDAVLPFKKTPANILKRGLEYSPAGLAKSLTVDMYHMKQYLDYQKGKLDVLPEKALSPTQVIDHICAGLSGTAITTLGFLLAGTGAVSCGLDDDEDKFEKAKGGQAYAVNLGKAGNAVLGAFGVPKLFGEDVTFTLDWAAPMSMPFFVGAAIRNELENGGKFDVDKVIDAFGNITEPVLNLSMLDGVNTLFKTSQYDDTDTLTQIGAKVLTNYATSYVPSVLGAVSRTFFDDKQRKAFVKQGEGTGIMGTIRYAIEQAENKIPGVAQTNIAARNIWGEEKTTGFLERLFENFILPGYISKVEDDPILNEMGRLYEVTGDAGMIPKEDPGKSITVNKEKRVLEAEQWDQYKATRNRTAHKELTDLLNNPDYQNAADSVKVQMINDVWSHADQVGKHAVFPDYELKQQSVGQIAKDGKVDGLKNELVKALEAGDYDAYETMVEAIRAEFDDEKDADATIKDKIGRAYRDKWNAAYRDGDEPTMTEIEDVLGNTGMDFNIYIGDGKGKSWQEQVDEKYDTPEAEEGEDYRSDPRTWTVPGMVEQGNIDLDHRKVIDNGDGSISTERSFNTEIDGVEVLLPTIIDGKEVSEDEAVQHYFDTGEHLGKFSNWQDAVAYAQKLHNRQDWYYHQ